MYTWLVELTLGRSGVLSTVTMASPYGRSLAGQLIRPRKHEGNRLILGTVNLPLRASEQSEVNADGLYYRP